MNRRKSKTLLIMVSLVLIVIMVGVSYAIWSMTLTQETSNVITTGCFKIEFQDSNPISLSETYPITDEEGLKFEPYTFTITNTCESYASYQINLEILNTTTLNRFEFVKNSLNEKEPSVLTNFDTVQTTLSDATTGKKLETGFLDKLESKTFTLRLWLAEDTPAIPEVMNKTIESKVTIISSLLPESPSYAEVITNCSNNGYRTADCMLENSKYDTVNLAYDETVDNNLRYIGANPNNYVSFNNELWRIIGVMNNVEDENGNKATRMKLIREESIGEFSWDTSASKINDGYGVNEWSQSDIMKLMNPGYESESVGGSLYWNRRSGECYNDENNATTSCDFTNTGLTIEGKNMIDSVIWYTGSNGSALKSDKILTSKFYELERSSNKGKICPNSSRCNDSVTRKVKWLGMVGLMYPSDYGYATSGGNTISRDKCLGLILSDTWKNSNDCYINDWLYNTNVPSRSITSCASLTNSVMVFYIHIDGYINGSRAKYPYNILPTVFLKQNIRIISGEGTKENSYKLELVGE